MRLSKHNQPVFHLRVRRIGNREGQRIAEHGCRLLKTDAVFAKIDLGLVLVPLKTHRHDAILPSYNVGAKQDLFVPANAGISPFRRKTLRPLRFGKNVTIQLPGERGRPARTRRRLADGTFPST